MPGIREPREALAALRRRADVRAVEELAKATGQPVRLVGGAVRDAFLRRRGADLDVSLPAGRAEAFANALAKRLGVRAVLLGPAGKRIHLVPFRRSDIEIWQEERDEEHDLLRRDFTVNALSFELPSGRFAAPPTALADLRRGRLALPRPGVFLEDPLRVLRAARFEGALPGFRVAALAEPELREAARALGTVAAERKLEELDRILALPPRTCAAQMRRLETWGVLESMMPGASAADRRRGLRRLARAPASSGPAVRRALLLSPLGASGALETLEAWRVPRRELRLAGVLLRTPGRRPGCAPGRREVVEALHALNPFLSEGVDYLSASRSPGLRRLAAALRGLRPAHTRRLLAPRRPITVDEVRELLQLRDGPELGRALRALDVALASGEVRGKRQARELLRSVSGPC